MARRARELHGRQPVRHVLLALILIHLVVLPAGAEGGVWGERGINKRFVIDGNGRLFAADGRGVAVYDISDPASLRRIDIQRSDDETLDVALFGSKELVTATRRGVERLSLAEDGTLTRRGSLSLGAPATRIAANEHFAAAATNLTVSILERNGDSLRVVRTLTKNKPVLALTFVGSYLYVSVQQEATYVHVVETGAHVATVTSVADFSRSGSILWGASASRGLIAIDVSQPGAPTALPFMEETPGFTSVAAAGSRVYAMEPPRRIHVFDAGTPSAPELLTTMEEMIDVIAASGNYLFGSPFLLDEEGLRYETGVPLRAIDVTVPSDPIPAGEIHDRAGPVSGVWTDGSIAYVVDPPFLRLLDVSTTSNPKELSSLLLPANTQERIRLKDGTAIVYGRGLVHVIDVSRPLQPVYAGTWDARGHPPSDAALLTPGRFVEANMHSGLHVVDYSNPSAAHQVGGRIWHYLAIASGDDAIYVLQESNFLALEVSGGTTVVDRWQRIFRGEQIEVSPPNASQPQHAITRGAEGLHVFALEDRFAPREAAHYPAIHSGVFGTGDGLVWLTIGHTLRSLALGQGSGPVDSGRRVTSPMQISVAGDKIVVADRYSVRVYGPDTEAPPAPRLPRRRAVGH